GLLCCLLALASLYQCAVSTRELEHPRSLPITLGLAIIAAKGIIQRRPHGWTALVSLCPVLTQLLASTELTALAATGEIRIGSVLVVGVSAVYAWRRRRELGRVDNRVDRRSAPATSSRCRFCRDSIRRWRIPG